MTEDTYRRPQLVVSTGSVVGVTPVERRHYTAVLLRPDGGRSLITNAIIDTDYGSWERMPVWYDVPTALEDVSTYPEESGQTYEVLRLIDGAFYPLTDEDWQRPAGVPWEPRRGYVAVKEIDGKFYLSSQFNVIERYPGLF